MPTTITAHCLVKNEENFVGYAIKSVINFVDKVLIFDTGSTDKTVEIIKQLLALYPDKIIFEEKGSSDKMRHTALRQEMVDRTNTDWFMILDGDEVWTDRAMEEALKAINTGMYDGIKSNFYECVGDVYHRHFRDSYTTARFVKLGEVQWGGGFNEDNFYTKKGEEFFKTKNVFLLENKFWHLTHLVRSSKDYFDYSSGGLRVGKRVLTYCVVGRKITEAPPEVFMPVDFHLSHFNSCINFISWLKIKLLHFLNKK